MNILTVVIMAALLMTIGLIAVGIWAMTQGGEFDQKHSTQLMVARVGMQGVTFLLLIVSYFYCNLIIKQPVDISKALSIQAI